MSAPTLPTLTPWQFGALRRYAKDFEKAQRPNSGRIEAAQALQAAKAALKPDQFAVVEFVAGRGLTIADLAKRTGRRAADLAAILSTAATFLARHYEAQGVETQ